jgi:hypothetical protein
MAIRPSRAWLFAAALTLAGCADPDIADEEEDLTAFTIKLTGSGKKLTATDSPKLASGAAATLACSERFDVSGRTRLSCHRGAELLEVIVAGSKTIVVDWPKGRGGDKRNFYSCTKSGKGSDGLPAQLSCKPATLHTPPGGALTSPFASTVPGIGIPNAHLVGTSGHLLRAMAPRSAADFDDVVAMKFSAVLIFKNQTNGHDVTDEIAELGKRGLPSADLLNVPFQWKELGSFKESCQQSLKALDFIQTRLAAKKSVYFHCTVGEDRTGYLSALYRLLHEKNLDAAAAWDGEMCEHGYGAGNPLKPAFVVDTLAGGVAPLYRKMAWLIATGKLTTALEPSACAADPSGMAGFSSGALPVKRLTCGTSTLFRP